MNLNFENRDKAIRDLKEGEPRPEEKDDGENPLLGSPDSIAVRAKRLAEYDVTKLLHPFLESLKTGDRILDLGAGTGLQAKAAARRGMLVTAVDILDAPENLDSAVEWLKQPLERFIEGLQPEQKFDGIYLQNIIHFFPKEYVLSILLPALKRHIAPGGTIAIETMAAPPEPILKKFQSFYAPDEILAALDGEMVLAEQEDTRRIENEGGARIFHHTRIVVISPK